MAAKKAKAPQPNPIKTKPVEVPKPQPATIKVIKIPLDQEFVEPEGWFIKDMAVESGEVYATLVKVRPRPGMRVSEPVELKS